MPADFQPEIHLHRIRAITLDLDNTLWAIDPVIQRAEATLWQWLSTNYPLIPDRFDADDLLELRKAVVNEFQHKAHDFRFLRKKVLERVANLSGYDASLVEPAFRIFDDARNAVELYPDVLPALEQLYQRYTVIAVTNGNANLETIGIRRFFHNVVTASDTGVAKPARPIFEQAVRHTGVTPEEILHVGDHPLTDVDGARQAGLKTAWINRTGENWPKELEAPDAIVTTMVELREMLEAAGE